VGARRVLPLAALALAFAVAGCGGNGDEVAEEPPGEPPPAAEEAPPAAEADGEAVFLANCAGCHTLAAAGTTGTVGPSLDAFAPSAESVESQVRTGGGGMPSFENTLSDEEIEAVSRYVAANAGG
jgi:mono/diheme cytochrome c family protein